MTRSFKARGSKKGKPGAAPAASDMEPAEPTREKSMPKAEPAAPRRWEALVRLGALFKRLRLRGRPLTAEHGLGAIGLGIAVASSAFASYMIAHDHQGQQVAGDPAERVPLQWTEISHFAKADIDPMTTGSIVPSADKPSLGRAGAGTGDVAFDPSAPRLPGYVLRDVFEGVALVEGHNGIRAVTPGFTLPEGNRVTAIERHAGKWIVVTTGGIIAEGP